MFRQLLLLSDNSRCHVIHQLLHPGPIVRSNDLLQVLVQRPNREETQTQLLPLEDKGSTIPDGVKSASAEDSSS